MAEQSGTDAAEGGSVWGWTKRLGSTLQQAAAATGESLKVAVEKGKQYMEEQSLAQQTQPDEALEKQARLLHDPRAPWQVPQQYIDRRQIIVKQILLLSEERWTFLSSPPEKALKDWTWEFDAEVAQLCLELFPKLERMCFLLVPFKVQELAFWRNYFARIHLIRTSILDPDVRMPQRSVHPRPTGLPQSPPTSTKSKRANSTLSENAPGPTKSPNVSSVSILAEESSPPLVPEDHFATNTTEAVDAVDSAVSYVEEGAEANEVEEDVRSTPLPTEHLEADRMSDSNVSPLDAVDQDDDRAETHKDQSAFVDSLDNGKESQQALPDEMEIENFFASGPTQSPATVPEPAFVFGELLDLGEEVDLSAFDSGESKATPPADVDLLDTSLEDEIAELLSL